MSDYKFKRKSRPIFGAQDALREDTQEDTPRYDMMPTYDTELDNISRLSKQERFLSPFIHQPEKVTPLEYAERKSGRKPIIWKDIPEEIKKRLEDKKTVVDAPTSREIDPITGTLLKYALAPGSGFAYGMGHAGDLAVESKKAFEEGDIGGGALGSLATLLRGGFSAATPFVPVLSAFATGGEVMSDVIGEEKTANIFTPVTQYTKPESLAGRSGAEIADLLIQLGLAKSVHSTMKGKRGQKIGEGFADEAGKIIGESLKPKKDFGIKPEETKGIKDLTQEKLPTELVREVKQETKPITPKVERPEVLKEPVKKDVETKVEKPITEKGVETTFNKVREIEEVSGGDKLKKISEAKKLATELRQKGINAEVKQDGKKWNLYIDKVKQDKRSLGLVEKTEKTPIEEVPIKHTEAKEPYEVLGKEKQTEQIKVIEGFVVPKDLPSGYGEATIKKGLKDIKDNFGKENSPEAKLLRDVAEDIIKEGTDVRPVKGSSVVESLSPEQIKEFINRKEEPKITPETEAFELISEQIKVPKKKNEQLSFETLAKAKVPEKGITGEGKLEGTTPLFQQKTEAKGQLDLGTEIAKPKTLYDVLRDKPEYDVKVIATELNKPTREINKQLKDLEFKGLITKRGKNFKPTEEMEVLLNDIKNNPKKYGEDLNSLYSNPIPALVKGVDKATGYLDDVWQHAVGDKIFKKIEDAWMKILPEKVKEQIVTNHNRPFDWIELKRETRVSIDKYNELAGKLYRDLIFKEGGGKLTNAEQVRLQQIIRGSVSKNEPLRMKADQAIKEIKALETIGKELEVLPIETYNTKLPRKRIAGLLEEKRTLVKEAEGLEGVRKKRAEEKIDDIDRKIKSNFKHGGEGYFKRVYGSKEQGSKWAKYGVRPYKLDLTSAIRRKDIPWEVRKEMGEVLQAGYPVAKGVKLLGRDVSIGKMFEKVAENPEWASGVERPGFIQLPKDKKLGKLSDKFVEEKIASDILDIIEFTKPEYLNAVLKDVLTTWKATKTIMNPATHGRNVMSESIMADFGGVSHLKQAQLTPKAVEILKGKGERQAEWKLSGLQRTTFAEAELGRFLNERQGKKIISPNVGETLARIYGKASLVDTKLGETMRKFYQLENEFFKALHFLSAREKGMTIAESRNQANKWGMDYGDVPRIVEKMRTNPFIGMPFITWSFKAFPRIIEAAITRPITFWKYPLLFSAVTNYSLEKLGITDEEWQEIKSTLPDRMAQGMWMLIPFRDEQGKIQMLDLTYTLPYKDVYDVLASGYSLATSGVTNRGGDIISGGLGLIQAPITQLMAEVVLNKSGYTKQPIFSEVDSPLEKATKTFDHIYKAFMPALAPEIPGMTEGGYSYHKLRSVISDREDYYGRAFSLAPAIGSSFLGLKTSPVEPEKNLERKSFQMGSQIADLGSKRNRILRDGSLSEEQRLSKAKDVDEKIGRLKAEKKELDKKITKDSEIAKLERRIKRLQRISSQFGEDGKRRNQEKINKLKIELNKLTQ